MRESDDAAPLITLVPWRWNAGCGGGGGSSLHLPWGASTSPGGGGARRELLWHAGVNALVAPLVVGAAVRMLARLEDDGRRPLRLEPRSFSA